MKSQMKSKIQLVRRSLGEGGNPKSKFENAVCIRTYGCQMNRLDSEMVCSALRRAGYRIIADYENADIILFNTCSVREHAEQRVFSNIGALRRLKDRKPSLRIGVLGCMAQRYGDGILRRAPHVDLICGPHMLPHIVELLARAESGPVIAIDEKRDGEIERASSDRPMRHSAFVAVSRGCDNYCAYCVVPYVRGNEISRPPDEIEHEVRLLADDGAKEITLLGQNVDTYGKGLTPAVTLADLLYRLSEIGGLERLRFATSHPRFISLQLLQAMRDLPNVCEHLHMPAQSGSNRILAAMKRGYTRERYLDVVAMAREIVPGIAIAGDFIVGFPGETPEDFDATARLMAEVRFQNCFIFKYSAREGTAAAELPDDVSDADKQRRNHVLLKLQEQISREENAKYVGSTVEALTDGPSKSNPVRLSGRLRTNHIVVFDGDDRSATEVTENAGDKSSIHNGKPGRNSVSSVAHCRKRCLSGELVSVLVQETTPLTLFGRLVSLPPPLP